MPGQKINWWDSDLKNAPPTLSNVDIYCNLRWNDSAKKSLGGMTSYSSKGKGDAAVQNASANAAPAGTTAQNGAQQPQQDAQQAQQVQQAGGQPAVAGAPQTAYGSGVQSTPVIQPFVVVPYSTPMQPMYHYSDGTIPIGDFDSDYMRIHGVPQNPFANPMMNAMPMGGDPYNDIFFDMNEKEEKKKKKKERKPKTGRGVSAGSILIILLIALFATLPLFIGKLLPLIPIDAFAEFAKGGAGDITLYNSFEMTINALMAGDFAKIIDYSGLLAPALLTLGSVFLALVFLVALFTITRKYTPAFGKIMAFFALVCVAAAGVCLYLNNDYQIGLVAYVTVAIVLLIFIITLFGSAKKAGRRKRAKANKRARKAKRGRRRR